MTREISRVVHAGPGEWFGPAAFVSAYGTAQSMTGPDGQTLTAKLIRADAADDGLSAVLIYEITEGAQ